MPGPGNYNPHDDAAKSRPPAFSMRPKTSDNNALHKSPGPGQYNPKFNLSRENLGGVKIGSSSRDALGAMPGGTDIPGPGTYALSTSLGGPAFGIGSSNRDNDPSMKSKQFVPGPGSYKLPSYTSNLPKYTMPDKADNLKYI